MTKVMAVISEIRSQKDSGFCLACVLWLSPSRALRRNQAPCCELPYGEGHTGRSLVRDSELEAQRRTQLNWAQILDQYS